jgi:hypothetical protein
MAFPLLQLWHAGPQSCQGRKSASILLASGVTICRRKQLGGIPMRAKRSLTIAAALLAGSITAAAAADMPVAPPPPPAYNWTG